MITCARLFVYCDAVAFAVASPSAYTYNLNPGPGPAFALLGKRYMKGTFNMPLNEDCHRLRMDG